MVSGKKSVSGVWVVGCIWDNLGDVVLAMRVKDTFPELSPQLAFYWLDPKTRTAPQNDYLDANAKSAQRYDMVALLLARIGNALVRAKLILHTTPKYNELLPELRRLGFRGHYYRIFDYGRGYNETYRNDTSLDHLCRERVSYTLPDTHDVFTGFGRRSKGIFLEKAKPAKTLPWWGAYTRVYTAYSTNPKLGLEYLAVIGELEATGKDKVLVVMQGHTMAEAIGKSGESYPVKESVSWGGILYRHANLDVWTGALNLAQSLETFHHSESIVMASGNMSMSACMSWGKAILLDWRPELTKTQCLLADYLRGHGWESLIVLYRYWMDRVAGREVPKDLRGYVEEVKPTLATFQQHLHTSHNLESNLRKYITQGMRKPAPVEGKNKRGGDEAMGSHLEIRGEIAPDMVWTLAVLIATVVLILLVLAIFGGCGYGWSDGVMDAGYPSSRELPKELGTVG